MNGDVKHLINRKTVGMDQLEGFDSNGDSGPCVTLESACAEVKRLAVENEWREVLKEQPPNGELILACDMADNCLATAFRVTWRADNKWYSGYVCGDIEPPTHWMLLPSNPGRQEPDRKLIK